MSENYYTEIIWSVPDALIWHDGELEPRRGKLSHGVLVRGTGKEAYEKGNALLATWFQRRVLRDLELWPECKFRVKELPMDNVTMTVAERIILSNMEGSR